MEAETERQVLTLEEVKNEILEHLKEKPFWDRVLPVMQMVVLIVTGAWVALTYYIERREKATVPANVTVVPTLEDLGLHDRLRYLRAQITVENKGTRAFVIKSPYTIYAVKMTPAPSTRAVLPTLWDGSFATEGKRVVVRSGESFGRGFWFETGERNIRTYIVAVPNGDYDLVDIRASVQHSKVEDDSIETQSLAQPDHSIQVKTIVTIGGKKEEYNRHKHRSIWARDAIGMNDGNAQLALWTSPSAAPGSRASTGQ